MSPIPTVTESPYLKTPEVAALLRKSVATVRGMRHRGTGPKGTKVGRAVLYHRDDVQAWLQARTEADHLAQRAIA